MDDIHEERTCPEGAGIYIWQNGDTLTGIAQRFGVTVSAVRMANEGMSLEGIASGERICIPSAPTVCPSGRLYTVRKGDTISGIAQMYGLTTASVMEQNPYVDPLKLQIGQVLCLPADDQGAQVEICPAGCIQATVRYGDTLAAILIRYNMSYEAFIRVNPRLEGKQLTPGQRYFVPDLDSRGGCAGTRMYQLQEGEGLEEAARSCGLAAHELLICNKNLAPGDFVPGRMICVPGE